MRARLPEGVSRETRDRLQVYVALLLRWQTSINLIAPESVQEVWTRHIADCLQLADLAEGDVWADLGSGAGLPGLVIAAARPELAMSLLESDGRKSAFLRIAAREMRLGAKVVDGRIERTLPRLEPRPQVVTARALAPLDRLLGYAAPALAAGAVGLFPKGQRFADELTRARESWHFAADIIPSATDADARILRIRDFGGPRQDGPNGRAGA